MSEEALEAARAGAYLENIAADVSPERLRRFFTRVGARYQISRAVRDACLFARHDITRDVPYSRLDLVSCRNVLIYLDPAAQRRIVPLFHYALVPGGGLVLGAAEALREGAELFSLLDKSGKIYVKSAAPVPPVPFEPVGVVPRSPAPPTDRPPDHAGAVLEAQREADRLVMSRYAPPGVLVGADLSIVQFRGRTGPYLDPAPGEASLDVLKMARVGLALELRNAIQKARRSGQPVRVERIGLRDGDQERRVAVEVVPLTVGEAPEPSGNARGPRPAAPGAAPEAPARATPWLLVLFEEQAAVSQSDQPPARAARGAGAERKSEVERELAATKDYLRATIEEHEALSEELQSANEELISSNEELRSINDELVAAKEELLAANAELTLLNQELAHRNAELRRRSDDLGTLLRSVEVPIVLLANNLTLRHYTPQAERLMSLLASDVGRPLGGVAQAFGVPEARADRRRGAGDGGGPRARGAGPRWASVLAPRPAVPRRGRQERRGRRRADRGGGEGAMSRHLQRASYGIYVRFRRSRLPLRKGIDTLEHALVAAAALRAGRFHDGGDVFVVKEPEGTIVEPTLAEPSTLPPPASSPLPEAPRDDVPSTLPTPLFPRAVVEARADDRARMRLEVLEAQLVQSQRAIARARAAQERFERAYVEAERVLRVHGRRADEAILSHRARVGAARELSARTVAHCEESAALLVERVEAVRRSRPAQ